MINQPIEILGVTPISHFPKCPPHHPCTQFCEIDKLCIPSQKIKIDRIRKVIFKVCIDSFKTICTPAGKKVIIHGKKLIKVFFTIDDSCHCIHCADFDIPFCTFVLLKDAKDEVVDICSVVEDVSIRVLDSKCLTVTSVIFVCPVFKKDHQLYPSPPDHTGNCKHHGNYSPAEFDCHNKQQCTCHTPHNYHLHHDNPYQSQQICKHCQSSLIP